LDAQCLASEWLDVDGTSGYACGTVSGQPGRRYHGWLVACPDGTPRRHHFMARAVEFAGATADVQLELGGGAMVGFAMRPWPTWEFDLGDGVVLRRELVRPQGARAVLWRYTAVRGDAAFRVEPHLTCRDGDHLHFANEVHDGVAARRGAAGFRFQPYEGLPALLGAVVGTGGAEAVFDAGGRWIRGVPLALDLARGYDGHEDHYAPGAWSVSLPAGGSLTFAVALQDESPALLSDPAAAFADEAARRAAAALPTAAGAASPTPTWRARVARSADDFLYRSPEGRLGVLAGFPWFGEWGRDTFLSLPGLTLARGRLDLCADGLMGALPFLRDGLLPNIFGADTTDSDYGSVDASLWYARAVLLYDRAGGDRDLVLEALAPALVRIATAYRDGTGLGVAADDGMLLLAGREDLNATWMDARVDRIPVTPRHGCAVEMNALWYQLLAYLSELGERRRDREQKAQWGKLRDRARTSFLSRFWLPEGYLADVWRDGVADRSIRPNMVLASAQELSPLSVDQRRGVLEMSRKHLLTPRGLRTLAPSAAGYQGRFEGGPAERDRAYHQGTVWPWLLGAHVETAWRIGPRNSGVARELVALWEPMAAELDRAGLEHFSEVFDGDAPQRPGGTFAQAWNTAECLRSLALVEARP